MKVPAIAHMNLRLALEAPVETIDPVGGILRAWRLVDLVWARVRLLGGQERAAAAGEESAMTHEITLRWRADVTGAMRLRNGARVFEILSAADAQGARRHLVCRCREIA